MKTDGGRGCGGPAATVTRLRPVIRFMFTRPVFVLPIAYARRIDHACRRRAHPAGALYQEGRTPAVPVRVDEGPRTRDELHLLTNERRFPRVWLARTPRLPAHKLYSLSRFITRFLRVLSTLCRIDGLSKVFHYRQFAASANRSVDPYGSPEPG